MAGQKDRAKIIDALMALAAEGPFNRIGLADIADKAGVSLATMRDLYAHKFAILADFARHIDKAVLEGEVDAAETTTRGRLLDLFMRRFDALAPYKAGLKRMAESSRWDPLLGLAMARLAAGSNLWLLAAAGVDTAGLRGAVKAEALVVVYAQAMRVWLTDEDPGLGATMAALDKALDRAAGVARSCERASKMFDPLFARFAGTRSTAKDDQADIAA